MKIGAAATVVLAAWIALLNGCASDDFAGPRARIERALLVDDALPIARRYAPVFFHAVDREAFRGDIPTRIDFDGTMRGDDNWEHLPRFEVLPTVYYAVVETDTHWFVTYHLFHPRDFAWVRIGLHETHENDGENCQVVVERASGRIVLLLAQAHYDADAFAPRDAGFRGREFPVHQGIALVGGRPAFFVESGGHGILSATDEDAGVDVSADGTVSLRGDGIVLRPALGNEPIVEPTPGARTDWPYALESTIALLWDGVRDGSLLGDGGILDGTCDYVDDRGRFPVPRYYEGDRFSGPFGPDRGISPFALDFDFDCGTVGALVFDPARRYAECLVVPSPWSTTYTRMIPPAEPR